MPENDGWDGWPEPLEILNKKAQCLADEIDKMILAKVWANKALPYPEPGVYWVKWKTNPIFRGVSDWSIAEVPKQQPYGKTASDEPEMFWLIIGRKEPAGHSQIAEIGPRILPSEEKP